MKENFWEGVNDKGPSKIPEINELLGKLYEQMSQIKITTTFTFTHPYIESIDDYREDDPDHYNDYTDEMIFNEIKESIGEDWWSYNILDHKPEVTVGYTQCLPGNLLLIYIILIWMCSRMNKLNATTDKVIHYYPDLPKVGSMIDILFHGSNKNLPYYKNVCVINIASNEFGDGEKGYIFKIANPFIDLFDPPSVYSEFCFSDSISLHYTWQYVYKRNRQRVGIMNKSYNIDYKEALNIWANVKVGKKTHKEYYDKSHTDYLESLVIKYYSVFRDEFQKLAE